MALDAADTVPGNGLTEEQTLGAVYGKCMASLWVI